MAQRGRPATGHKPVVSVRMAPEVLMEAKGHARASRKALGAWLEDAIREKMEREEVKFEIEVVP